MYNGAQESLTNSGVHFMVEALFAEFEPATRAQWLEAVRASLRGDTLASLRSKTYEGIDIHPLPDADDLAGIAHQLSLPGQFPFVRGARASGYRARPWLIASAIDSSDPREFNRALRDGLANGQTAVVIADDTLFDSAEDIRLALAEIDLARCPLLIQVDARAPAIYRLLCAALADETLAQLNGCIGYDPLCGLARSGFMPADAFEQLAAHTETVSHHSPQMGSIAISTAVYHDAGANAVQELALATATGVAYLRALHNRGFAIETVAPKLHFCLKIGEHFFMEIAKFRAIRLLWAQVLRAFGLPNLARDMTVHARSGARNKSRLDAHVNLLRLTTEALSAAIGGVDSIELAPFDQGLGPSDDASRLSRNLQLILQEEQRLVELIDPAGGAPHVEILTDQLARGAWSRFQAIEAEGGLPTLLRTGTIQAEIEAVAEARRRDTASGDAVLVGVNRYLNADTPLSPAPGATDDGAAIATLEAEAPKPIAPLRLAAAFEAKRAESGSGS